MENGSFEARSCSCRISSQFYGDLVNAENTSFEKTGVRSVIMIIAIL